MIDELFIVQKFHGRDDSSSNGSDDYAPGTQGIYLHG